MYCLALAYIGYFKGGRPEGYGVEFSVPGDEDYYIQEVPINDCQNENDVQEMILKMANPRRYEGEFKEGEYSGKGNEYVYEESYSYNGAEWDTLMDEEEYVEALGGDAERGAKLYEVASGINKDITIYVGTYEKGEMKGEFKIYIYGSLYYEGGVKKGKCHGKGIMYYPMSEQIEYEGEWANDDYHGNGTLYNEDGTVKYEGKWEYGDYAN